LASKSSRGFALLGLAEGRGVEARAAQGAYGDICPSPGFGIPSGWVCWVGRSCSLSLRWA